MDNIIVTTPAELEKLVSKFVKEALLGQGKKPDSEFVGIDQAAETVNLSKHTLYGMVSRREVPFYKRGKKLYFKPCELQAWIGSQKFQSREELATELRETGSIASIPKKGGSKC